MPTMKLRNLGCRPASFLSRAATGLLRVFNASVPSFKSGSTIIHSSNQSSPYILDLRILSNHETQTPISPSIHIFRRRGRAETRNGTKVVDWLRWISW
nr:hypothetical protein Itr_chr14CG04300 [Ipomoea trifida]